MADGPSKSAPPKKNDAVETTVFLLVGLILLGTLAERLLAFLQGNQALFSLGDGFLASVLAFLIPLVKTITFFVGALSVVGTIYYLRRLTEINTRMNMLFNPPVGHGREVVYTERKNERWEKVVAHLNSESPNDWKFAIIEADIILNELLDAMGYQGETMSEKMKNVERSDFHTIDKAWEAHKVRNIVAHEGSDFVMSKTEAERVIGLFEAVFREFQFI